MNSWKLYYDGGCNLCHASQLRAEKWAQRSGQPLEVDVLLCDDAIAKGYGDAMVLEADGEVFTAERAWLKVLTIAPWYFRWLASFAKHPLTLKVASMGYRIVAKYRIKWFGSRACQIPTKG